MKNESGTALAEDVVITYTYFNEAQPDNSGVPQATVDLTTDLRTLIQGNTDIKNAIQNVLNEGGNVYFTTTAIAAGTPQNQLAIPANSFYTVNQDGVKIEITVPVNISQLITAIKNATTEQKNDIKLQLGDNFATNNTSVFTGDTVTIGGTTLYVYRGIFTTTVNANTANTTGIVLDKAPSRILSMNLRYAGGLVANTTDLTISTNTVSFRIGTGKMYQVLGTANVSGDVTVEFASTVVPAGIN